MRKPKALKPMEQVELKCGAVLQLLYTDIESYTRIRVAGLPFNTYKDGSDGILACTSVLQEVVDFLNRLIVTQSTPDQQREGHNWHRENDGAPEYRRITAESSIA